MILHHGQFFRQIEDFCNQAVLVKRITCRNKTVSCNTSVASLGSAINGCLLRSTAPAPRGIRSKAHLSELFFIKNVEMSQFEQMYFTLYFMTRTWVQSQDGAGVDLNFRKKKYIIFHSNKTIYYCYD